MSQPLTINIALCSKPTDELPSNFHMRPTSEAVPEANKLAQVHDEVQGVTTEVNMVRVGRQRVEHSYLYDLR